MNSTWRILALVALLAAFVIAAPGPDAPSKLQPRAPQASKRMGQRRRRSNPAVPKQKKDYSAFLCPAAAVACPVGDTDNVTKEAAEQLESQLNSLADWFKVGFECIELDTELNQCGGCLALGKGQDCSTIPNARATACETGSCAVLSCKDGFVVSPDRKQCLRPDDAQIVLQ